MCDDGNTAAGDGCSPQCRLEVCGNSVVDTDLGETCDDGNYLPGDGCGPACLIEGCGNRFIDPGETCDDGNRRSHDGCDSGCKNEIPVWTEISPGLPGIAGRAVYDAVRHRVVLIGHAFPDNTNQVWEWDGRNWINASPMSGAPSHFFHEMAYDDARGEVVMLGDFDETWIYDGIRWKTLTTDPPAPSRRDAAVAYDAARQEVVVFGGGYAPLLGDTWTWDGDKWELQNPATSATPVTFTTMVYDGAREEVVLFGGSKVAFGEKIDETWVWNGEIWDKKSPALPPTPRTRAKMAYDAARGLVVLFGGDPPSGPDLADTHEWNGTEWSAIIAPNPPELTSLAAAHMLYHAALGQVVLVSADTMWAWNGIDWAKSDLPAVPSARQSPGMAYDSVRKRHVLFSGVDDFSDVLVSGTWEFDGSSWLELSPEDSPPDRARPGMAFDPIRGRTVMFGGRLASDGSFAYMGDTWEWDGENWHEMTPSKSPLPRELPGMTYDPARQRVVLFGGWEHTVDDDNYLDTWEWDGENWEETTADVSPTGRGNVTLVFDNLRSRLVLHKMIGSTTWEWNGTAWEDLTPVAPASFPGTFNESSLVFDRSRGRTILFGGPNLNPTETWEWDGSTWLDVTPATSPSPRSAHVMTYDTGRRRSLMYGGWAEAGELFGYALDDTWELQYASRLPDEVCFNGADDDSDELVDCDDPDCEAQGCGWDGLTCSTTLVCECPGGSVESACDDSLDNDCDGVADCADSDCTTDAFCAVEANCDDGLDNDSDGAADCADPGCRGTGFCTARERTCDDNEDNDGDGLIDCDDVDDCFLSPSFPACP